MSRPSIELVRTEAARYRHRVANSCATALTVEEIALVGGEAARAAARRAIHMRVTQTSVPTPLLGALLVAAALPWPIRLVTAAHPGINWPPFPISWSNRVTATHDAPAPHSGFLWTANGLLPVVLIMMLWTIYLYKRPPDPRSLHAWRPALVHTVALGMVSASLILFAVSGGIQGGDWPTAGEILVRLLAQLVAPALALLGGGLAAWLYVWVASALRKWVTRPVLRPYDLLLLALVDACAETHTHRSTWFLRRSRKVVERALGKAARHAEIAVPASIFPGGRGPARADTQRLASVIRRHRTPIARASGPASFDLVVQSLSSGVLALIDDDWEALTAAAPPVTALSRLRRVAAAVWPAAVLVAAAVALPWIPAVAQAPAVADGVRVTLIITAVLGLVLPRESSAKTSILDAFDKAMSRTVK